MIRLRQVALVARDLDAVVAELEGALGLSVAFRDPGVAEFGLRNALMVIGDQFLEVVSPTREGTTAGRLLDKRGGDGGYMAIFEVDDLDRRIALLDDHDVRVVWSADARAIRGRHLHPSDTGGTLVSIDQPDPAGSWAWAGPDWEAHRDTAAVSAIAGVHLSDDDPAALRSRWEELELATSIDVVLTSDGRPGGLDVVELVATDRSRRGESMRIAGVDIHLV